MVSKRVREVGPALLLRCSATWLGLGLGVRVTVRARARVRDRDRDRG